MIKKGILLLVSVVCCVATTWAYDFAAVMPTGQTLYFSEVAGGVQVVYPANVTAPTSGWDGFVRPTGAMTIPATVSDGTTDYAVVSLGNFALYGCVGLTSLTLSEGIVTVGTSAIRLCSSLTTVYLPSTLTQLGNFAFAYDAALADVWVASAVPPTLGNNVFYDDQLAACTLHVACSAYADYMAAATWGDFGTIQDEGCQVTVSVSANYPSRGTVTGGGTYNAGTLVTLQAFAASGYCFVCWQDGDTLNPRLVNLTADCAFRAMFFAVQHDTVTLVEGDTVQIRDTIYDTIYLTVTVHDTVPIHDTIVPTFFTLTVGSADLSLGVGVGSAVLPAGAEVEVCGLPMEGARFVGWEDGETVNPRRVTVNGNKQLRACFERLSVTGVEELKWTLAVMRRDVTVAGVAGQRVRVYDTMGRQLMSVTAQGPSLTLRMPAAGVYLLQVGDGAARKVTIL